VGARQWSAAIEDYLKAIYLIEESGRPATGVAIAERLGVAGGSVTPMVKRLVAEGLVDQQPYRPAVLTARGRLVALEVVRHHRLLELFLSEALGMTWDRIHAEAEVLEHHISEDLEDLIAARLGDPDFDPHGHPIPRRDGTVPVAVHRTLRSAAAGDLVTVAVVDDEHPDLLRYLEQHGVRVGTPVHVREVNAVAGTITLEVVEEGAATQAGADAPRGAELVVSLDVAIGIGVAYAGAASASAD
jgi:DtxR family Mn-dependent transcriptional regulator